MNTFDARAEAAPEPLKSSLTSVLETAETVSIFIKNHQFDPELVKNGDFIAKLTEIILSRVPYCQHADENAVAPDAAPATPVA